MTESKRTVGRRFTRREVVSLDLGGEVTRLDPLERFDPSGYKAAAIAALEAAGVPARSILAEHPGGSALRDYVINSKGHEPDSMLGIAARLCEQCIRAEVLSAIGVPAKTLMAEAYRLGRLVTLAAVYGIEATALDQIQRQGAGARRKYNDAERANWCDLRASMFAEHSTRRAAQLIVMVCGLPSEATETVRATLKKKMGTSL